MRLRFLVEGQSEESFVNNALVPYLWERGVEACTAQKLTTSRRRDRLNKGGIVPYERFLGELGRLMKEDSAAVFTTMLDLYGLPEDYFPEGEPDSAESVEDRVREGIESTVGSYPRRIIPYIQQHEFETLLLTKPDEIGAHYGDDRAARKLAEEISRFDDVERVNRSVDGAPSKRITRYFPAYGRGKSTAGPMIAGRIGLPYLRQRCRRFDKWITQLEQLADEANV